MVLKYMYWSYCECEGYENNLNDEIAILNYYLRQGLLARGIYIVFYLHRDLAPLIIVNIVNECTINCY